jgi:hypothetical protein
LLDRLSAGDERAEAPPARGQNSAERDGDGRFADFEPLPEAERNTALAALRAHLAR